MKNLPINFECTLNGVVIERVVHLPSVQMMFTFKLNIRAAIFHNNKRNKIGKRVMRHAVLPNKDGSTEHEPIFSLKTTKYTKHRSYVPVYIHLMLVIFTCSHKHFNSGQSFIHFWWSSIRNIQIEMQQKWERNACQHFCLVFALFSSN